MGLALIVDMKKVSKKPTVRIPTESEEQIAFLDWMRYQHPTVKFFSVPNGFFSNNFGMIQKLKKEGLTKGVMDIFIMEWGVALEMKRQKGGVLSPEQKEWKEYLEEKCGMKVIVAKGCQDAVNQVMEYLRSSDSSSW